MNVVQMRQAVFDAYPGESWKKRVRNMHEHQVIATYRRLFVDKKEKK